MRRAAEAWSRFFFEPRPPEPLAAYRVLYGLCVLASGLLLVPDYLAWYGPDGLVPFEVVRSWTERRLDLFALFPESLLWARVLLAVLLASALSLTLGFWSRTSAALVFLCLASLHHRNPFILNGGDSLLRVMGYWLMLSPCGDAYSLDARGKGPPRPSAPWAMRMLQLQLCLAYLGTGLWKLLGPAWRDGTAVHYALSLADFKRFPLPGFMLEPWAVQAGTWGTLVVELSLPLLLWSARLRPWAMAAGLGLHLGLEYAMNIPMFQWAMLSAYALFLEPATVRRLASSVVVGFRQQRLQAR